MNNIMEILEEKREGKMLRNFPTLHCPLCGYEETTCEEVTVQCPICEEQGISVALL